MPGDVVGFDKLPQWLSGAPLHRLISSSVLLVHPAPSTKANTKKCGAAAAALVWC